MCPHDEQPRGSPGPADFSLVLGGPLYQLLLRAGILRPPLDRIKRRVIVLSVVAWAPLLILSTLQGQALGGVEVPFLQDVEVQVRFLFALPLLIVAELVVHQSQWDPIDPDVIPIYPNSEA